VNFTPQSTNQKDMGADTAIGGKGYHCEGMGPGMNQGSRFFCSFAKETK
jgi:hypothetical protein